MYCSSVPSSAPRRRGRVARRGADEKANEVAHPVGEVARRCIDADRRAPLVEDVLRQLDAVAVGAHEGAEEAIVVVREVRVHVPAVHAVPEPTPEDGVARPGAVARRRRVPCARARRVVTPAAASPASGASVAAVAGRTLPSVGRHAAARALGAAPARRDPHDGRRESQESRESRERRERSAHLRSGSGHPPILRPTGSCGASAGGDGAVMGARPGTTARPGRGRGLVWRAKGPRKLCAPPGTG